MTDDLEAILDDLRAMGYDDVERTEGFENEASGVVALPEEFERESRTGWRRFLPRVHCDAGNPTSSQTTSEPPSNGGAGPSRRWAATTTP